MKFSTLAGAELLLFLADQIEHNDDVGVAAERKFGTRSIALRNTVEAAMRLVKLRMMGKKEV